MGTNFYARVIPREPQKKRLHELIDSDDFSQIKSEIDAMYATFRPYRMSDKPSGEIHLGKRSGGWKFLWNPNVYVIRNGHMEWTKNESGGESGRFVSEPDTAYYTYPLTKDGIKAFIDREDIEVYDEYDEKQDKDTFFKEALEWTTWKDQVTGEVREAWDSKSYNEYEKKNNPSWRTYISTGELVEVLKKEGFDLSEDRSDFYSDGLRFSTCTDFC